MQNIRGLTRTLRVSFLIVVMVVTFACTKKPQAKSETSTKLVLEYTGPLGTSGGVHLKVFRIEKLSTSADPSSTFQNKFEVDDGGRHINYIWPDNTKGPFAGDSAIVKDIDSDDRNEIVVFDGDDVRVVSYDRQEFRFRSSADVLDCRVYDVKPTVIRGKAIFTCGVFSPSTESKTRVVVPRLFEWTSSSGFGDVTGSYGDYYKAKLMPRLRSEMASETDPMRKAEYHRAIDAVTHEIGGD